MSDDDLVKRLVDWSEHDEGKINDARQEAADRIEALTAEKDEHWKSFVHWRKEADALTEQLEAARADAKEAEAYAEELQGDLTELCRQLIAAEAKLATCEEIGRAFEEDAGQLRAKLAKAVEELERQVEAWSNALELGILATQHRTSASILLDGVRALLAEIEGEKG